MQPGPRRPYPSLRTGRGARTTGTLVMMDFAYFIPITLFICIVLAIKVITDARVRRRIAETNPSEELVKTMLLADEQNRRLSALKWGLVLTVVGVAFGLISAMHLEAD